MYWITLYVNDDNVTYLDSFRAEYFHPRNKNIIANKDIEKTFTEYKQIIQ